MFNTGQDLAFCGTIGAKFIRHDHSGHVAQALQQLAKEALGRFLVAAALDQHIEHVPVLINRSPEIVQFAPDANKHLASRAGESHPRALPEPYVTLSRHTAPDVRPFPCEMENGFAVATELLPLPVGSAPRRNTAAPSVQSHYRTFRPTTGCAAPVPRIGTLVLAVLAAWTSPLAAGRQVLTFHTRA